MSAHPLGNFSINQFSRIEAGTSQIKVRQIIDLAEIPVFQESTRIDTDKDGTYSDAELRSYLASVSPAYLQNLKLRADGIDVPLSVADSTIAITPGAGGLATMTMRWDLVGTISANAAESKVDFENQNYADRLGWNEIVVNQAAGVSVFDSTAYGSGVSGELKAYPAEGLNAPLAERKASFSLAAGTVPSGAAPLKNRDGQAVVPVQRDRLAELIAVPALTPALALFGLLLAFGFGAMHAMSPGHGKTVVGAYLVGSRGTLKHAVFLGATVTITHTLGVFALGLITLFASNYILPERLMPFLSFTSGLMVFFIGVSLFNKRVRGMMGLGNGHSQTHEAQSHSHEVHSHADHSHGGHSHPHEAHSPKAHAHSHESQDHSHPHELHSHGDEGHTHSHGGSTHSHLPPKDISWKSLLGLGISGGLLPCPSALVLMLSAISLGRIGYGLLLTVVFSFGLAATLTSVGVIFLYLGKAFGGTSIAQHRIFRVLPALSALVIAGVGAVICYSSLA